MKVCMYTHTHTHICTHVCILMYMHAHEYLCVCKHMYSCVQPALPKKGSGNPSSLQVSTLLESLTQSLDWLQAVRSGLVPREGRERVCLGYDSLEITCCRGEPQGSFCQDEARAGAGSILPARASSQLHPRARRWGRR